MNNNKYVLTLDLHEDLGLIELYKEYHKNVWPEIIQSIRDSGIHNMEIYNFHNKLCMIIEVDQGFSFENKIKMDTMNPIVQKWETLMEKFQNVSSSNKNDSADKWKQMELIFDLNEKACS